LALQIETSRFGTIDVDESSVVDMAGGLIGFPEEEKYVLIRHNPESPFYWLQAVHDPDLAFVIVDPRMFKPDFDVPVGKKLLSEMKVDRKEELGLFVIVTIPRDNPENMTANLLGPLIINSEARLARQLVLDEKHYSHRFPILKADQATPADSSENAK
jgi:flagellar assembly factor FliW